MVQNVNVSEGNRRVTHGFPGVDDPKNMHGAVWTWVGLAREGGCVFTVPGVTGC